MWLKPYRVQQAVAALGQWRKSAKSTAAVHLWPLLALLEKGVAVNGWTAFGEDDDRTFWDRYFRYTGEERSPRTGDSFTEAYYVEPLTLQEKPSDYPHRGPSTIRDRTFRNAWRAGVEENGQWRLAESFASTFRDRVLQRGDELHPVPLLDLGVWLFRNEEFAGGADTQSIVDRFRERFHIDQPLLEALFSIVDESPENLFQEPQPTREELNHAIRSVLVPDQVAVSTPAPAQHQPEEALPLVPLEPEDALLVEVKRLLALGTSGIILKGCPGTSKSWYAERIAETLVTDREFIFKVQFHPSYGYEDFVEGFVPNEERKSGFSVVDRVFMDACAACVKTSGIVVVIVDEINRGDPARVFGELLTYIEIGHRDEPFRRPYSGKPTKVPRNLLLIGTMNPYDRSITQLDLALGRRFDQITLSPDAEIAQSLLSAQAGFSEAQIATIVKWFEQLQLMLPKESGGIGHTYFRGVFRSDLLRTVWEYRMLPYCEALLEQDPDRLAQCKESFSAMLARLTQ